MKRWRSPMLALIVLAVGLTAPSARAQQDSRLSVTVAFGAGLNTTGADNHHVLPFDIRVQTGGVVNFAVAGLHQIYVYLPGKTQDDVVVPDTGTFINDNDQLYYGGINPTGTPPAGFSNTQNRVESVSFSVPGTYLVICNIRGHFLNGMYAFITVEDPESTDHHDLRSGSAHVHKG
jgi:plastocyanin